MNTLHLLILLTIILLFAVSWHDRTSRES